MTSNSVDSDETAHYEPSHLDLYCLRKPNVIACDTERALINQTFSDSVSNQSKFIWLPVTWLIKYVFFFQLGIDLMAYVTSVETFPSKYPRSSYAVGLQNFNVLLATTADSDQIARPFSI